MINKAEQLKQLEQMENEDPFQALRWENLLDDVSNAHSRLDTHLEDSDEWLLEFTARAQTHAKVAEWMYSTIVELKQIVGMQTVIITALQEQLEALQAERHVIINRDIVVNHV